MKHDSRIGGEIARTTSGSLYDRLERAVIALEYALADVRKPDEGDTTTHARSQEALLSAGEEIQDVLLLLKTAALGEAAARVKGWS